MQTIQQYIENYLKKTGNTLYGSLISSNKNENHLQNSLTSDELEIYETLKNGDRQRLMNTEQTSTPTTNPQPTKPGGGTTFVGGIGEITQKC